MRVWILYALITFVTVYAWKDWLRSLCMLLVLSAFMHDEDMPRTLFGIQGLSPWNVLLLSVMLAWYACRCSERRHWDMPRHAGVLLLLYLGVIVLGVLRAMFDRSYLDNYPLSSLISEELINTIKWTLPGLLLFDGCRTRRQVLLALAGVISVYVLFAVQAIYRIPWSAAISVDEYAQAIRAKRCAEIGYSAPSLSSMLAGASWGMLAALALVHRKKYWLIGLATAGMIAFGQALTGGRAGYLAWGATGLTLCLIKWRKYLLLAPVVVVALPIIFPGSTARMLQGFGQTDASGEQTVNDYQVTSGRTMIWPYVVDKIGESPVVGYGRLAMVRTGLRDKLWADYRESFPHPHNMYLQTLLDNGILGSIPIFLFWGMMLFYSTRLLRSPNHLYVAVGGLSVALMLAQLFAGIGSLYFYPTEGTVAMWAAMFLALRVHVEEKRAQKGLQGGGWDGLTAITQREAVFMRSEESAWQ